MIDRDVQYFLVIAQESTLALAAERLGMTQPALSRAVQRLEQTYRLQLIERTARGVILSEAGRRLAERAAAASTIAADAQSELADLASGARGMVRLAAGHTVQAAVTRALVPRLQNERPAAVLQLDIGFNDEVLPLLEAGAYDFVVCGISAGLPASLTVRELYREEVVPVVRNGHPLASVRRLKLADLLTYPWAGSAQTIALHYMFKEAWELAGLRPPTQVITTNSWDTLMTIVARSDCISIAPKSQLEEGLGHYRALVHLDIAQLRRERNIAMVWRAGGYVTPVAQRAMDLVEDAMKRGST